MQTPKNNRENNVNTKEIHQTFKPVLEILKTPKNYTQVDTHLNENN